MTSGNAPQSGTVIVMESDDSTQQVYQQLFTQTPELRGLKLLCFGNTDRVIEHLEGDQQVKLLITAIFSPSSLSGLRLLYKLKANPATAKIPVMVVTSQTESQLEDQATALGAVAFIPKPFRVKELSARILDVLNNGQS